MTLNARAAQLFDRLSTSYKLFAILGIALMPISVAALLLSVNASRRQFDGKIAEFQSIADSVAASYSRALNADLRTLRLANARISGGQDVQIACNETRSAFAGRIVTRPFAVYGPDGLACATSGFVPERPVSPLSGETPAVRVNDDSLDAVATAGAFAGGVVRYDRATLTRLVDYSARVPGVMGLVVEHQGRRLIVFDQGSDRIQQREVAASMPAAGLTVHLLVRAPRATISDWLLALLPIIMWIAAAIIAFLVTDHALIRPLDRLRRAVIAPNRDGLLDLPALRTPAHEIRDLADALTGYAAGQVEHERAMSGALGQQTALTREVHHRVKNNLQVIASLISLHARASESPESLEAFAAISRRVDALAIVHRNHYAQLDDLAGLELKPVLSELVSNLVANLSNIRIELDAIPARVALDTATSLAFLVTEIVELAAMSGPSHSIQVTIGAAEDRQASLTVRSLALDESNPIFTSLRDRRYGRISTGLARQLRVPLNFEPGAYSIDFGLLGEDEKKI